MNSYSLLMMFVALGIGLIGLWLFHNREDYSKWFYLAHGTGFIALAFGVYPETTWMAFAGVLMIVITAGLQLASNALIEAMAKGGVDIVKRRTL